MLVHTTMSLAARSGAAGGDAAGAAATSGLIWLVLWRLGCSARQVTASQPFGCFPGLRPGHRRLVHPPQLNPPLQYPA
jgi:hypothetical protein